MTGKMRNHGMRGLDEQLDKLGVEVVRAASLDEAEAEAASSSPFLYSRVRSRIVAELARRDEKEGWLSMLLVFWRAVPAMALVAIVCLVLFLSASPGTLSTSSVIDDSMLSGPDAGIERAVFAESQPLSSDEVLATIMNRDDGEVAK